MELLQNLDYQAAFGAADCAGYRMRQAILKWFRLYYDCPEDILQLPYTVVRKLSRAVFAEYAVNGGEVIKNLPRQAFELALIGGESYLKFVPGQGFRAIPRGSILVFRRDENGQPTDVGMAEKSNFDRHWFTLLERRTLENGILTVKNRLFRSISSDSLGREVSLKAHPAYAHLPAVYSAPGGMGLIRVKMPMVNCVDGSAEGVSIYAPAAALMEAIRENELQLQGEFRRGQSRLVVSRDLLSGNQLKDDVFVALDDSPEAVGITVFAPELRTQSYLDRQQAYLRALENVIGLKRGLLSQVEAVDRTATEITSSEGEYMTVILELRQMWEQAVHQAAEMAGCEASVTWGDNVV